MERVPRQTHTKEFREHAVQLVQEQKSRSRSGETTGDVGQDACELGVSIDVASLPTPKRLSRHDRTRPG